MSEGVTSLRHQITNAEELDSVVRSMKAMASSNISQYENAVRSLDDYYRTVQLGLTACFQQHKSTRSIAKQAQPDKASIGVIVFGSDQGLVGQFNEVMVEFVSNSLMKLPGNKTLWAVGERLQSRLADTKLTLERGFMLPNSINTVSTLVGNILIEMETQREQGTIDKVYLFHHRPHSGSIYTPVSQQLLPLDHHWQHNLASIHWPTNNLPEVMPEREQTLRAMVREYLFVSLFRACAESLASENASRLSAMQRAEKNIDELHASLKQKFHSLRQSGIDAELFDVISGFGSME
ncbi:F0F1 ATP synthase subunit gamma [Shewanella frigidimarina]|uniref:H+transporting two-sector ATPase, gamma subunit n=1 Tax=Shewanella frigidimarina (strain NCIMB 400) TaxID=318167 RepID=Q07YL9_SHEFN|nr:MULTISPECIES: F0F1 ATP synthase subunit gamma [Shewanella]ABI72895.1 H+transporting two-sector ATPase, gamma subunit [Shewanella frigidimarina NCIMB 400]PKH99168.1 F0F1 ATP synthase subunit gamma [Shewanella sp. 11B5]|tara:strand:- start:25726 stop:26604 length:879 start_codon:yes stop_codon:yes gene_type:complete